MHSFCICFKIATFYHLFDFIYFFYLS
uniref:Uncharacterized protein n=1 Tax=Rhizophora mucronata TaxID=61149 RepID=A0A2P2PVH1_RHIMU